MNILNKKFTFKELFSSVEKMKDGSKIGKRYVETRDGTKIPLELVNKVSKREYGVSNFYTLWRQDGNAGQTVVMKAYEEFKKSAKQRMKEGGPVGSQAEIIDDEDEHGRSGQIGKIVSVITPTKERKNKGDFRDFYIVKFNDGKEYSYIKGQFLIL